MNQALSEVQAAVVGLRDEVGLGFDQIARQLEVSGTRAQQIYREALDRRREVAVNGSRAVCLLPGRARWVLEFCGYTSWAQVRAAMETGELQAWHEGEAVYWRRTMLRSVGRKTWAALYEWAERPILPPCDPHPIAL